MKAERENEGARARWEQMEWDASAAAGHIYLHVGKWMYVSHMGFDRARGVNVMSKHVGGSILFCYALPDGEIVRPPKNDGHWPVRDAWLEAEYKRYCELQGESNHGPQRILTM